MRRRETRGFHTPAPKADAVTPHRQRQPYRCERCRDYGMIAHADTENGPEFDTYEYCTCPAGERRQREEAE